MVYQGQYTFNLTTSDWQNSGQPRAVYFHFVYMDRQNSYHEVSILSTWSPGTEKTMFNQGQYIFHRVTRDCQNGDQLRTSILSIDNVTYDETRLMEITY